MKNKSSLVVGFYDSEEIVNFKMKVSNICGNKYVLFKDKNNHVTKKLLLR